MEKVPQAERYRWHHDQATCARQTGESDPHQDADFEQVHFKNEFWRMMDLMDEYFQKPS
jgi:hypothetical protein